MLYKQDIKYVSVSGSNILVATYSSSYSFGFIPQLPKSTNSLIVTIEKSWSVRIDIWNF